MSPPPDLTSAPDQEVIALARQGREDAYRELLRRYQRPVYRLIWGIVGNRQSAEDLTQETFVRMFHAIDRFSPERKFSPWILTIGKNAALNYVKVKRRRPRTLALEGSPFASTTQIRRATALQVPDPSASTPADALATAPPAVDPRAFHAALQQAIARLGEPQRSCAILRIRKRRSHEEIAKRLHLPVATVKTCLHRARTRLREELKGFVGPLRDQRH